MGQLVMSSSSGLVYTEGNITLYIQTDDRMGLLPDMQNCGLRMRRKFREPFPRHWLQRKPLVNDPGMHHVRHARAVMHVGIANPR